MSTPKEIAKKIKAKGLQKLRWYCQMCEKQCRDENGFKCHCASESHLQQMMLFAETPQKYVEKYSKEFMDEFLTLLSRRYGTKRVLANAVYQEFIQDRHHLHMNATKWESLTDLIKWMGREGIAEVDETPKGWFISWIDRSPKALEKAAAEEKRAKQDADDESRQQRLLLEQVQRAKEAKSDVCEAEQSELIRESAETPIKIELSMKPGFKMAAPKTTSGGAHAFKKHSIASLAKKSSLPPQQSNLPRQTTENSSKVPPKKLTAMEEIILQEQERKRRFEARQPIRNNERDRNGGVYEEGAKRRRREEEHKSERNGRGERSDAPETRELRRDVERGMRGDEEDRRKRDSERRIRGDGDGGERVYDRRDRRL